MFHLREDFGEKVKKVNKELCRLCLKYLLQAFWSVQLHDGESES